MLVVCRSLNFVEGTEKTGHTDEDANEIVLKLIASLTKRDDWTPFNGFLIEIIPIESLLSMHLLFRSMHDIDKLPNDV